MPIIKNTELAKRKKRTPEEEKRVEAAQQYIQQREKMASKQDISSKEAGRALIPQEDVRVEKETKEKALTELKAEQVQRQEAIMPRLQELLNPTSDINKPQPNPNLPFGIAQQDTIRPIIQATGGDVGKYDQIKNTATTAAAVTGGVALATQVPALLSSTAAITGTLGKLSGFGKLLLGGLGLGSAATIFNALTSGRVSELEGDIIQTASHSKTILTDIRAGADARQAINELRRMESEMWDLAGKLHLAMKSDVRARLKNKDLEEFLFANLDTISRRIGAAERFAITKNPSDIDALIGMELPQ